MTRELSPRRGAVALAAIALALAAAGLPAAADAADRALVTVYANGVDFLPQVAYQRAILTVSGNGTTFSRSLDYGQPLAIGMFDPAGDLLADGRYRWRLELVPPKGVAARLRAAAEKNGGRAPDAWQPQTGAFTIAGGFVADPALVEATALPRDGNASGSNAPAPAGPSRSEGGDDDDAVGFRGVVEGRLVAAAPAPVSVASAADGGDTDAVAAALGRSPERPAISTIDPRPSSPAPAPRSDGSNGRPRS